MSCLSQEPLPSTNVLWSHPRSNRGTVVSTFTGVSKYNQYRFQYRVSLDLDRFTLHASMQPQLTHAPISSTRTVMGMDTSLYLRVCTPQGAHHAACGRLLVSGRCSSCVCVESAGACVCRRYLSRVAHAFPVYSWRQHDTGVDNISVMFFLYIYQRFGNGEQLEYMVDWDACYWNTADMFLFPLTVTISDQNIIGIDHVLDCKVLVE